MIFQSCSFEEQHAARHALLQSNMPPGMFFCRATYRPPCSPSADQHAAQDVPHEISVLIELTLGHLRYHFNGCAAPAKLPTGHCLLHRSGNKRLNFLNTFLHLHAGN